MNSAICCKIHVETIMKNETSQLLVSGGDERGPHNENERLPSLFSMVRDGAVLMNTGSTARDQLANERTYLAWMRTALSLIGAGLALLKWDAVANAAGYLLAALGIVLLVTSTQRYFRVMRLLQQGKFEPNVGGIISIVAVTVAAIVAAFYLQHTHQL
jgi:putative membrane protein